MTSNDIEKALECCVSMPCSDCYHCPYDPDDCTRELLQDSLDYIKKLKAEKEQIRKETAEEILKELKKRSIWFIDGGINKDHFDEQYEEICKQFNVEENK